MKWSVAKAREQFSELLRKAANEPQEIYNRDRLVAAVLGPDSFRELSECAQKTARRTLKESFAETRKVMAEEGYQLEAPPRKNRKNDFPNLLDELPR
jgi:methionine synthase I (cobalamin-dependent)